MTYSHMGNPTLPSALRGFTSEFGKGSGGSLLLWSPAQLVWILASFYSLCDTLRFPNLYRWADWSDFSLFILAKRLTKSSCFACL